MRTQGTQSVTMTHKHLQVEFQTNFQGPFDLDLRFLESKTRYINLYDEDKRDEQ